MFLAFNSGIESIGNSSIFTFSIPLFALYGFQYLLFKGNHFGVSNVLLAMFPDEHGRLPHFFLAEAGGLCSMGQHYLGFLRVLFDALLHLGYNRDVPIYRHRLSMAHGLDVCEVSMTIPFDPKE
jgi:hypothetical protein